MRCRSPRCPTETAEGSRFCAFHRDLFATIRSEIDDGKVERLRSPERRPRRRTLYRSCDVPGCRDWAAPNESRCLYHLRALGSSMNAAEG